MTDLSGNMVNKYSYDEFGNLINAEETIPNPFLYVGQYGVMDEENGLLYMRARYYDPEVGRFINKDPIGFEGGVNFYAYVENNPINEIDPKGFQAIIFPLPPTFFWVRPWWWVFNPKYWRTIPKENWRDWAEWAEYNLPPNRYPPPPPKPEPWWYYWRPDPPHIPHDVPGCNKDWMI